jgi:hypothetical protein
VSLSGNIQLVFNQLLPLYCRRMVKRSCWALVSCDALQETWERLRGCDAGLSLHELSAQIEDRCVIPPPLEAVVLRLRPVDGVGRRSIADQALEAEDTQTAAVAPQVWTLGLMSVVCDRSGLETLRIAH